MAKNKIQEGNILDLKALSGETTLVSGGVYKRGLLVGVITSITRNGAPVFTDQASAEGDDLTVELCGCWRVPKATSLAITAGDKLYWDATAGNFNKTASGNTAAGHAIADAGSADTEVKIRFWQF